MTARALYNVRFDQQHDRNPPPQGSVLLGDKVPMTTEPSDSSTTANSPSPTPVDEHTFGVTLTNPERSLLRRWLGQFRTRGSDSPTNPDIEPRRIKRWENIGWEVFERKALLLAAARDLSENGVPNPLKLAATDIFVEKAQTFLTQRATKLYWAGVGTALSVVALLGSAAYFVYSRSPQDLLHVQRSNETVSPAFLTVVILKATTAGGFVVGLAYFLISLSRALFHEATVLYSRRHSLRFGRLFVYLMSDHMTREDLVAVFNWNAEFSTAFKDIQADQITKTPLMKVLESPRDILKAAAELTKSARDTQKGTKEEAAQ